MKMIHTSMHHKEKENTSPYGYMEFVKKIRRENELPGDDFIDKQLKHLNSNILETKKHDRKSETDRKRPYNSNSLYVRQPNKSNGFKRSKFRPENGIMQKKFEQKQRKQFWNV